MMGSISKRIGLVALVAVMVTSAANAATLFNENFENLTIGETVSGNTSTTVAGSSWAAWGSFYTVSADPTGAAGNVLKYENGNSFGRLWANFGGNNNGNLRVSYDFYIPTRAGNPETYVASALVADLTATPAEPIKIIPASNSPTINTWNYKTAAPGYDNMAVLDRDKWYTLSLEIPDFTGDTGNVSYYATIEHDGTKIVDHQLFGGTGLAADATMNVLRFAGMADNTLRNSSYYYLDNISVETIPEPMTLSLLCAGGFACVLRRRKSA